MNPKTTLVLFLLVVGIGAWVFLGEQQTQTSDDLAKEKKKLVPSFKQDDAKRVEIAKIGTSTETYVIVREDKGEKKDDKTPTLIGSSTWRIEKPLADKADDGNVRSLVSKLEWLESIDTLEGERAEKANKETFGKVEQSLTIARDADKGGDVTIEIGAKLPGDARYARVVGRPLVYVIPKDLSESLEKDLFEYRSKDLVTVTKDEAARVVVKMPTSVSGPGAQPRVLELARTDRFWRLGGAGGDYADKKKVEDLIDKARNVKPSAIEKDSPTKDEMVKFGFEPAFIELTIEDGKADKDKKRERLVVGAKIDPAKDVRWAMVDGRTAVWKIDAGELEKELRRDNLAYRSDALVQLPGGETDVVSFGARWKGGPEVRIKKESGDWKLEKPPVRLEDAPTKELLKKILDLKVATREGDATDLAKFGLADPGLVIEVGEEGTKREVLVGEPVKEKVGYFYAKRGEDARVLTISLGDLPNKIRSAPLDLRSKTVFKASHWDAKKVTVTDPNGVTKLEAEKVNYKWTVKGVDDVDEDKVSKLLEPFDDLKAQEMVADVTSQSVAAAGLEKPTKFVVTLDVWDKDKKKEENRTLLVGKRDGRSVLVMEEGGPTIAKVDGEFVDRLSRGFQKGKTLFEVVKWDAKKVTIKEGDKELVALEKKDYEWYRGAEKLEGPTAEKLLDPFEKVEASSIDEANDQKKKERGLAPAWRTVTIEVKKPGQADEPEKKTLLIGASAGPGKRWVMAEGGTEIGQAWEEVGTKVDAWLKEHEPKAPEAPKPSEPKAPTAPGTGAPVTSPTNADGGKK